MQNPLNESRRLERSERVRIANEMRADGRTKREIAEVLGVRADTVKRYFSDPTGERGVERGSRYYGRNYARCGNCGKRIKTGNRCVECYRADRHAIEWRVEDRGFTTPCWMWEGPIGPRYGWKRIDGVLVYAHRLVYTQRVGPIPEGMTLDHLCEVKTCVNPGHLEIVTQAENARRYWQRRRALLPPADADARVAEPCFART